MFAACSGKSFSGAAPSQEPEQLQDDVPWPQTRAIPTPGVVFVGPSDLEVSIVRLPELDRVVGVQLEA